MTEDVFYSFWMWQWYKPVIGALLMSFIVLFIGIFVQDLLLLPEQLLRIFRRFFMRPRTFDHYER